MGAAAIPRSTPVILAILAFVIFAALRDSILALPFHSRFALAAATILAFCAACSLSRPRHVYLVDFACFRPKHNCRVPFATFLEIAHEIPFIDEQTIRFCVRILQQAGLGEETTLPVAHHYLPPQDNFASAREEAELVIFEAVDKLLAKTGVAPDDIDIIIVNCSLFAPTPSMADMVAAKYGFRSDVRSFHVSGMGCSASMIAIGLARDLLTATAIRRGAGSAPPRALVVSTEIITPNYYVGKERSMLLPNCLFRMGAAAALLSTDPRGARYRLWHVVRTHRGEHDAAYRCVFQEEDPQGYVGVSLQKDLTTVAGEALKANITALAPLVLPLSEQLKFTFTYIARKSFHIRRVKPYLPNFRRAFDHFCIHAGGRAVIDELQRSLRLSDENVEASRMSLHRFGNTSSSSVWYELAYAEAKRRVRPGHRVWMIGFGSGFKCNSAAWVCLRPPASLDDSPWAKCIHRYPVLPRTFSSVSGDSAAGEDPLQRVPSRKLLGEEKSR